MPNCFPLGIVKNINDHISCLFCIQGKLSLGAPSNTNTVLLLSKEKPLNSSFGRRSDCADTKTLFSLEDEQPKGCFCAAKWASVWPFVPNLRWGMYTCVYWRVWAWLCETPAAGFPSSSSQNNTPSVHLYFHIFTLHLCFPSNMDISTNLTHYPLFFPSCPFIFPFWLISFCPFCHPHSRPSTFHLSLFLFSALIALLFCFFSPLSSFYPSLLISSHFSLLLLHPFPYLSLYRDFAGRLSRSLFSNLCTKRHVRKKKHIASWGLFFMSKFIFKVKICCWKYFKMLKIIVDPMQNGCTTKIT